ncbi:MAG: 23S rRNA methyltransferase [Alphaproteobacteria bacterium CG11_big_fil_rev_8_21_14_0_20_39_49]|nr:MAG: 23S rRNA methyltransferase [Alphaproteobacteria bacterium CG11_big_fil_rev_8_21_14_0_20_39_49]
MPKDKKPGDASQGGMRQIHTKVKTARGRKRSSTKWLQRQLNDPYVQMAQRDGYRSRAAYKIIEIDDKFNIFQPGKSVVDLGAAPGGWTQVAVQRTKGAKVVGIDLQQIEPIIGATLIKYDFTEDQALILLEEALQSNKVDVVLSDMAAPSCGHAPTDHIRIMGLCEIAFDFAKHNLNEGGAFAAKILQGGAEKELLDDMKQHFKIVKHFKPDSSRKDSAEMYVVATGFKGS